MQIKPGKFCPLIKNDCVGLECNWFIQVRGMDPNTGKEVDEWGCSIAWLPHLLIENAKETRQGAAATESFRNEMVKANRETVKVLSELVFANSEEDMKVIGHAVHNSKS